MELLISQEQLAGLKAKDHVPLRCKACANQFTAVKCAVQVALKGKGSHTLDSCSRACAGQLKAKAPNVTCQQCGKAFRKFPGEIKKSPLHFCSMSCACRYNNQHNRHGKIKRSKAEKHLEKLIRHDFPDLSLSVNNRTLLASGLEIDLLLPTLAIAIELNGPCHYWPIYGAEKLASVQRFDAQKQSELAQLKYQLLTFDITQSSRRGKSLLFIETQYLATIKPLLK